MKAQRIFTLAASLTLAALGSTSCYIRISDKAKDDLKKQFSFRIEADKVIYSYSDSLVYYPGSFSSLANLGGVEVVFIQTEGEPKVVVKGGHITRDSVRVYNNNGRLMIDQRSPISYDERAEVYSPAISRFELSGSGDFNLTSGFKSDSLEITTNGSCDIEAYNCSIAGPLVINKKGSGDIRGSFESGSTLIKSAGSGDITLSLTSAGDLHLEATGSGSITLSGEAGAVSLSKSGSGDLDTRGLKVKAIDVKKTGSGDVSYMDKNGEIVSL